MRRQVAQVQPLRREIAGQRFGTRIGQHAPHLLLEHAGPPELAAFRQRQQRLVGRAAPNQEGQARRQCDVAHLIRRPGREPGRIPLDTEQKLHAREQRPHGHLDAGVEPVPGGRVARGASGGASLAEERQRGDEIFVGDWASVRAARQPRQNRLRAGLFLTRGRGSAREDTVAARSVADARRVERTLD